MYESAVREREFVMKRVEKVTVKGVLENLPGFLLKNPNYNPAQALDHLEGI
jgi:hypothetical protein